MRRHRRSDPERSAPLTRDDESLVESARKDPVRSTPGLALTWRVPTSGQSSYSSRLHRLNGVIAYQTTKSGRTHNAHLLRAAGVNETQSH